MRFECTYRVTETGQEYKTLITAPDLIGAARVALMDDTVGVTLIAVALFEG